MDVAEQSSADSQKKKLEEEEEEGDRTRAAAYEVLSYLHFYSTSASTAIITLTLFLNCVLSPS